jgi:cytoskeleton protein RodZ
MQTLGQKFRQAREAKALSIDDIAAELRINAQYLRALEGDDLSQMPGDFFYRSFVRQYAQRLGIPEAEIRTEIERSLTDQERLLEALPSQLAQRRFEVPPMPTMGGPTPDDTRRWLMRLAGLIAVLAACSGVYALWLKYRSMQESPAAPPAVVQQAPPQAAPPPVPKPEEPKLEEVKPDPPKTEPAKTEPAKTEAPKPEPVAAPAAAAGIRLVVTAKELTWLDVWRGDQRIFAEVIQPGASKTFEAPDRLRIRLGNAGGVDLLFNGKPVPPPGPRGQIRTVQFTPAGFEVVNPAPPKGQQP